MWGGVTVHLVEWPWGLFEDLLGLVVGVRKRIGGLVELKEHFTVLFIGLADFFDLVHGFSDVVFRADDAVMGAEEANGAGFLLNGMG